jgi:hypothetical protein
MSLMGVWEPGRAPRLGLEAVELARRLDLPQLPLILDTLATARHRAGDVRRALSVEREVVRLEGELG